MRESESYSPTCSHKTVEELLNVEESYFFTEVVLVQKYYWLNVNELRFLKDIFVTSYTNMENRLFFCVYL